MLQSQLRTIEWCCIHFAGETFGIEEVSALSGLQPDVCVDLLYDLTENDRAEKGRLYNNHGNYKLENVSGNPTEEKKDAKRIIVWVRRISQP